jgi:circadian clock protein KaiB
MEPDMMRPHGEAMARLRLYIARSTPNSVRAEHNLSAVLDGFEGGLALPELEIVDVFSQPRRAITDGVVVTPTLIGFAGEKRIVLIGDLADQIQVQRAILDLIGANL